MDWITSECREFRKGFLLIIINKLNVYSSTYSVAMGLLMKVLELLHRTRVAFASAHERFASTLNG
jgi:hypothetical protein